MDFYSCDHQNTIVDYDHYRCKDCGGYQCDSDRSWGPAAGKWFKNESQARFFKENGFLPAEELQEQNSILAAQLREAKEEIDELDLARLQDQAKITELEKINSQLLQQAEGHAQEARAQKSTVLSIYQELGIQLGDWNGKSPVVAKFDALKAQVNELRSACEAVKHSLEHSDIDGHVLWVKPPHQASAVHETVWDRLEYALEQANYQCLADVRAQAIEECALSTYEYTDSTNDACWAYTFDSEAKRKMNQYAQKLKESANAK